MNLSLLRTCGLAVVAMTAFSISASAAPGAPANVKPAVDVRVTQAELAHRTSSGTYKRALSEVTQVKRYAEQLSAAEAKASHDLVHDSAKLIRAKGGQAQVERLDGYGEYLNLDEHSGPAGARVAQVMAQRFGATTHLAPAYLMTHGSRSLYDSKNNALFVGVDLIEGYDGPTHHAFQMARDVALEKAGRITPAQGRIEPKFLGGFTKNLGQGAELPIVRGGGYEFAQIRADIAGNIGVAVATLRKNVETFRNNPGDRASAEALVKARQEIHTYAAQVQSFLKHRRATTRELIDQLKGGEEANVYPGDHGTIAELETSDARYTIPIHSAAPSHQDWNSKENVALRKTATREVARSLQQRWYVDYHLLAEVNKVQKALAKSSTTLTPEAVDTLIDAGLGLLRQNARLHRDLDQ